MATITGTPNGETLTGSAGNDTIDGLGGNDTLRGAAGDDTLNGGDGDDVLDGGAGNDIFHGGAGNDVIVFTESYSPGNYENPLMEVYDGGDGFDMIGVLRQANLYTATLTNIEGITFNAQFDGMLSLSSSTALQLGANATIVGNAKQNTLIINVDTAAVDLSQWVFQSFAPDGWDNSDSLSIVGSSSGDYITGSSIRDYIQGGDGDDTLIGGAGDDVFEGGFGDDTIDGGDGFDTLTVQPFGPGVATVNLATGTYTHAFGGTDHLQSIEHVLLWAPAVVTGSDADEWIQVQESSDAAASTSNVFSGGGGNDALTGGLGNDTLNGGDGDDLLATGNLIWTEHQTPGWAIYYDPAAGGGADILDGGAGHDEALLMFADRVQSVHADFSAGGVTTITVGGVFNGSVTNVEQISLFGGSAGDVIVGGAGFNDLEGNGGDDVITGGTGDNYILGGDGYDTLTGGPGYSRLFGGAGNDRLNGRGAGQLHGEDGDDTVIGSGVADQIFGEAGADLLIGGANDDTLRGDDGADLLYGETGADLAAGGSGNDFLAGQDGADQLFGEAGDDTLLGGAGNDFLAGQQGYDNLYGEAGADLFYFGSQNEGTDFIRGFNSAEGDKIIVQGTAFAAVSGFQLTDGVGFLYGAGVTPVAATATFYYDTTTKALWFDQDGTGGSGAYVTAFLVDTPVLHASDFIFG